MLNWFLNFPQLLFHHRMETLIIQNSSSEFKLLRSLDFCFVACCSVHLSNVLPQPYSSLKQKFKAFELVVQHSGPYCSVRATQSQVPHCLLLMPACFVSSGTKQYTTPRRKLGLELLSALSVWMYLLAIKLPEINWDAFLNQNCV